MRIAGTFNGTGAAVYLCVGFVPDYVTLWDIETGTNQYTLKWTKDFRSAEMCDGLFITSVIAGGTDLCTRLTATQGVAPYYGGDVLTATTQTSVAYGDGVYLWKDTIGDYKANLTYGCNATPFTTWTLGSSSNRTGNLNDDSVSSGNHVGEGSRITIRETSTGKVKTATVTSWTAGQGISANEVTLSQAIASGTVERITGMYTMVPIPIGKTTPAGFYMAHTTLSTDNAITAFEAGTYDDVEA